LTPASIEKDAQKVSPPEAAKPQAAQPKATKPPTNFARSVLVYAVCVLIAVALAAIVRYFLVEPYRIPTGSMLPTIQLNDMVLANKLVYKIGVKPKYKEIVVFKDPTGEYPQLIKRVIATGGQTVNLSGGSVYVDGKKLDEPYTHGKLSAPLPGAPWITFPYKVPQGDIWVMGDNRTDSADSRAFGAIPDSTVYGRAWWTYWPLSHFGALR